jgi:hypothetical protein
MIYSSIYSKLSIFVGLLSCAIYYSFMRKGLSAGIKESNMASVTEKNKAHWE